MRGEASGVGTAKNEIHERMLAMSMRFEPWFLPKKAEIAAAFSADSGVAVEIPLVDPRLDEIVMFGNGKDADMEVRLADGTEIELGLSSLTVECDRPLDSDVWCHDDYNVVVTYSGVGLRVSSLRVLYDEKALDDEFGRAVQDWVYGQFKGDLCYVVHVRIDLTAAES